LGFGFTLLVTAPLTPTLVSALYGVTHIGFISGFITTIHMIGGGLWAYLGGVIFDNAGNYDLAFLVSAVMAGIAFVCTLFIREERHSPPSRQRRPD
jgi:predicted MFS family arabinose efflux permease